MAEELAEVDRKVRGLLKHAEAIGRHIWQAGDRFPAPSATMFNIVKCPQDGTRLRLPKDSADLVVTCPTCHYRFAYNTKCVSFESSLSKPFGQATHWLRRIRSFLWRR